MKKNVLLFLYCLFSALYSAHGQKTLVRDKVTLQPLAGVVIYPSSDRPEHVRVTAQTDAHGKADLSGFGQTDQLIFQLTGYQQMQVAMLELAAGQFVVNLTEKTYSLDEIVVSASKFEEKRADVPQQIQVINAKSLAFMNQQNTADVLQQSGQVLVQKSQQGGGSPIIRGFEANKVLIVVDGVRMNNAIYRGGHLQNVLTLDNTILDKTEIVFGPGSVVYGSDALGGVMHFYTKNPKLSGEAGKTRFHAQAFARYSSANAEKTGHLDLNIGGNKWASLSSVTVSDFDDLRQGAQRSASIGNLGSRPFYVERINGKDSALVNPDPNVQVGSGYRQYDFLQKVLFQPTNNVSHTLNFQYSTSSDVPRYDRLTLVRNGKPRFGEWYYGPQKRLLASYQLQLDNKTSLYDHIRLIAAYQSIEESRHDRAFGNNTRNSRIEKLNIYSLNADLSKELGNHELRYGLEYNHNQVNSTAFTQHIGTSATGPLDTRYPNGGNEMQTFAAYFTHTWEISPQWILTDGLRYSNVRLHSTFQENGFFPFPFKDVTQQNGEVNGNLGLIFQPGHDWRFSALASSGFRAPNVDDLSKVFESVPGNLIVPNPNLKPEYTYNGELNISKTIAQRVRLEGTGFYTSYQNAITTQPFTLNGQTTVTYEGKESRVTANVNANRAYIYGFSAQAAIDFTSSLSLTSTLNYTYGRIRTDSTDYPLDHIAPFFGKTSLILNLRQFRAEFFTLYNGWKRLKDYNVVGEDNLPYATPEGTPAWYTLNLRTSYQINPVLQVQLALENILDRNYRVFASGISAPGRNVVVTLRSRF
jgi:hemoglobin/transferrin/lactoferrin receptor protein